MVDLEDYEIATAGDAARPATGEQRSHFTQPCGFFDAGKGCTIYADRFRACRVYSCALLSGVAAGDVEVDAAFEAVATARDLLDRAGPEAQTYEARERLRQEASGALSALSGVGRIAHTRRMLDVVAVDAFLDAKFRNHRLKSPR